MLPGIITLQYLPVINNLCSLSLYFLLLQEGDLPVNDNMCTVLVLTWLWYCKYHCTSRIGDRLTCNWHSVYSFFTPGVVAAGVVAAGVEAVVGCCGSFSLANYN